MMISGRFQRTCRTLRLLPFPCKIIRDTTASLQKCAFRDSECVAVPEAFGKTSWFRTELEVEANLRCKGSRSHVVCSAECREEVIECILVCEVHTR
jgi:hypothetical protein